MGFAGHCLCRAVAYEVDGPPKWVAHCHCESCRRHTGSVMATFAGVDAAQVRWTGIAPSRHESSPETWRSFCPRCGTPISYESSRFQGEIHFYLGTLESPQDMPAKAHVYVAEQLPWFEILDDCPRFSETASQDAKPVRYGPRHGASA